MLKYYSFLLNMTFDQVDTTVQPASHHWRKLPLSQKMLTLSLLSFVFILPVTLGFLGQSKDNRPQAAVGDPPNPNPVDWSTPYARIQADNFYLDYNGERFYSDPATLQIRSNDGTSGLPQTNSMLGITIGWKEHDFNPRISFFTSYDGANTWNFNELQGMIYNNSGTQGLATLQFGSFTTGNDTSLGPNAAMGATLSIPVFHETNIQSANAVIHFENLRITPYTYEPTVRQTPSGYYLQMFPIGMPNGVGVFQISNPPNSPVRGYMVDLKDSQGNNVLQQATMSYEWSVDNSTIGTIIPSSVCRNGVQEPCPEVSGSLVTHQAGMTKVRVKVFNTAVQPPALLDEVTADFIVLGPEVSPTTTPTLTPIITPSETGLIKSRVVPIVNNNPGTGVEITNGMFMISTNFSTYFNLGRIPVVFEIQYPSEVTVSAPNKVSYFSQEEGATVEDTVFVNQGCTPNTLFSAYSQNFETYISNPSSALPVIIEKISTDTIRVNRSGAQPFFHRGRYYGLANAREESVNSHFPTNIWAVSTSSSTGQRTDFNNDGAVDISDYTQLHIEFFVPNLTDYKADATCDNAVDLSDYSLLHYEFTL